MAHDVPGYQGDNRSEDWKEVDGLRQTDGLPQGGDAPDVGSASSVDAQSQVAEPSFAKASWMDESINEAQSAATAAAAVAAAFDQAASRGATYRAMGVFLGGPLSGLPEYEPGIGMPWGSVAASMQPRRPPVVMPIADATSGNAAGPWEPNEREGTRDEGDDDADNSIGGAPKSSSAKLSPADFPQPLPCDGVVLVSLPPIVVAVTSSSHDWGIGRDTFERADALRRAATADGLEVATGPPLLAQYNVEFALSAGRTNEVRASRGDAARKHSQILIRGRCASSQAAAVGCMQIVFPISCSPWSQIWLLLNDHPFDADPIAAISLPAQMWPRPAPSPDGVARSGVPPPIDLAYD
eukprot:scaffold81933_cov28-Tisochrysis_lutea.AAC.6